MVTRPTNEWGNLVKLFCSFFFFSLIRPSQNSKTKQTQPNKRNTTQIKLGRIREEANRQSAADRIRNGEIFDSAVESNGYQCKSVPPVKYSDEIAQIGDRWGYKYAEWRSANHIMKTAESSEPLRQSHQPDNGAIHTFWFKNE